jgi:ribosomal protein L22
MTEQHTKHEDKTQEVKEEKTKKVETVKKTESKKIAVVNAKNLPISTKHAMAIAGYIKNKNVDVAIGMLEEVLRFKKAVPMRGEIPHRKGNMMGGRYPINATKVFITLLKSVKANALNLNINIDDKVLAFKCDVAPRPFRKFGRTKFKRTHVTIKLIKKIKKKN